MMARHGYRTIAVAFSSMVFLAGCQTAPKPLYAWGKFPKHQYDTLLKSGGNPPEQISAMQAHADKAKASNEALPPGFRAHLGMLHLNIGQPEAARELWIAEKTAFPESSLYVDRLLKQLDVPSTSATNGGSQ